MRTLINQIIFGALILVSACSNSDEDCDTNFNSPFVIEIGDKFCLADETNVEVTAIGNSYCPCNVECIWQGETSVHVTHTLADGSTEDLIIHEEMVDQNPPWGLIASVKTNEDCVRTTLEVKIVVLNIR